MESLSRILVFWNKVEPRAHQVEDQSSNNLSHQDCSSKFEFVQSLCILEFLMLGLSAVKVSQSPSIYSLFP